MLGLGGTSVVREYWMIYRGPGLLALVWFGSTPTHFPPLLSATCLSFSVFLCVGSRAYWGRWGGGGGHGAESYDRKKAWTSINHSCLQAWQMHIKLQGPNSWTKSRQKSSEFSYLIFAVTYTALPWNFYFFKLTQPLTVFTVQLLNSEH